MNRRPITFKIRVFGLVQFSQFSQEVLRFVPNYPVLKANLRGARIQKNNEKTSFRRLQGIFPAFVSLSGREGRNNASLNTGEGAW